MAELPKSVVERMKAQAAPQEHPDADLLGAFSEQALTGRERESVLAHLAVCAACREAVALAAPPLVAVQPGPVLVPWYRRPQIFAWAGSAATLALVAALVVNYGRSPRYSPAVTDTAPAKTAGRQPAEDKPATPAETQATNGTLAKLRRDQAVPQTKALAKAAPEPKKKLEEERPRREMDAVTASAGAPAAAQTPAKDQKKLEGGPLPDQYSAMKQAAPAPAPAARTAPAGPAANVVSDGAQLSAAETVSVENAAAAKGAGTSGAAIGGVMYQSRAKAAMAPVARWSITDKGKLQRSLDSGRTWQSALANESTLFRALAVVGQRVWAGGVAATLFHSPDGGATWTKQTLPGASGDIVSLQFTDALHGSAHTADGNAWSTTDGGQHWARQ